MYMKFLSKGQLFKKYISKTMLIKVVIGVLVGAILALAVSFFLPMESFGAKSIGEDKAQSSFDVSKAFNLTAREVVVVESAAQQQNTGEYLLREFAINGIFLDGKDSLVIANDASGGVFVHVGEAHKGYVLDEVFLKKARFKKGADSFWSFLDPMDEKEFKESAGSPSGGAAVSSVRETVAQDMFEDVIYKDGVYYIPKDILSNKAEMMRHLTSAGARVFNTDGVISFKISYLPQSSVFYKLGLRKDDFIVGANGEGFKSINDPVKFFQNIGSVKNLSISVKRANESKEFVYEVY